MAVKHLKIGSLLLDQQNPRVPAAASQRDCYQYVIDDQQDKLANLADDIIELGLSPTDNFLVMRSPTIRDKFIVLEGNRRLAALKILQNPNVLTGLNVPNSLQRRLETAAKSFRPDSVEPLACFEVQSREEANTWIQRRHTGEDEGRGIVAWNAQAAARFRGEDPALQALEFVRAHGGLSDEQVALLSGRFITTLRRLLETPSVRDALGLSLKKNVLYSLVKSEEVIKGLRRIVLDLAEKRITVTQLKTKNQMSDYVNGIAKADLPNLKQTLTEPVSLSELGASPDRTSNPPSPGPRPSPPRPKPTPPRVNVVTKPYTLNVTNPKAQEIYEELKALRLASHPHAIAVLMRVFLEISVDAYLVRIGVGTTAKEPKSGKTYDKNLRSKIDECVKHMISLGAHQKDFAGILRAQSINTHPLSTELLNAYVHNRFVTPTERDLTAAWDNAQPLLERIWPQ